MAGLSLINSENASVYVCIKQLPIASNHPPGGQILPWPKVDLARSSRSSRSIDSLQPHVPVAEALQRCWVSQIHLPEVPDIARSVYELVRVGILGIQLGNH